MQSWVGKRVKFNGDHNDVHSLGIDDWAIMLWQRQGVVHSGPASAGDGNRQWCTVRYGESAVESFVLPADLLELVD